MAMLNVLASHFGLESTGYGRTLRSKDEIFRIVAITPNRSKCPINAERVNDGRGFNFPTDNVAMRFSSVHAIIMYTLCSFKSPNMQLRAPYPWLVCAEVPGLERRAMKKMSVDEAEFLSQLHRWRDEAEKRLDCQVSRICVAYEAGRDGFWLARFLRGSGIEAHVMHSTSIPVNRDHRRAKTDRLDCHLMMRAFLGWLRREEGHCRMVAVPTAEQEDARRVTCERNPSSAFLTNEIS